MENPVIKKLRIKEGMRVAILNAPEGYVKSLGKLPEDVHIELESRSKDLHDLVHLFAYDTAGLNRMAPSAVKLLKENGALWISYPKKSSGIKTDLSRDKGWTVMNKLKYQVVSLIAIDETWSAARFKLMANMETEKKSGATERSAEDLKHINQEKRTVSPPADLKAAFSKHKTASAYFETLSFTHKKEYVRWIIDAKREETRKDRVLKTIDKLSKGKNL